MDFQTFKRGFLGRDFVEVVEYSNDDLPFQISTQIKKARLVKGLTQKELAIRMNTKQESIARAEKCVNLPSISFLVKMANAMNSKLIMPFFDFLVNDPDLDFYHVRTETFDANLRIDNKPEDAEATIKSNTESTGYEHPEAYYNFLTI